jgi:DNA-binding phage protein
LKDRSHDDAMAELFRDDPALAAATLNAILADGDQGELLVTLRQIASIQPTETKTIKTK